MISFSAFDYAYLWFPFIGFIVGFLGSFTGGGGGFIFIPMLTILFGIQPQVAISSSLAATLPICLVGVYGHYKKKNLDLRLGLIFAGAGIIGALLGARVTGFMTARVLRITFGVYSILIATVMYLGQRKDKKTLASGEARKVLTKAGKCKKYPYGFLSGGLRHVRTSAPHPSRRTHEYPHAPEIGPGHFSAGCFFNTCWRWAPISLSAKLI